MAKEATLTRLVDARRKLKEARGMILAERGARESADQLLDEERGRIITAKQETVEIRRRMAERDTAAMRDSRRIHDLEIQLAREQGRNDTDRDWRQYWAHAIHDGLTGHSMSMREFMDLAAEFDARTPKVTLGTDPQ